MWEIESSLMSPNSVALLRSGAAAKVCLSAHVVSGHSCSKGSISQRLVLVVTEPDCSEKSVHSAIEAFDPDLKDRLCRTIRIENGVVHDVSDYSSRRIVEAIYSHVCSSAS